MNEVKLRMSIIGVGNAGCQACVKAAANGHKVFVINSSQKDLNDSIVDASIPSYLIGNKRGAGRNRDTAKLFMKVELKTLFANEVFDEFLAEEDIIVVVASTAGGTGSGAAPLLVNRIQTMYPNKTVIFFGVLPKNSESAQAQFNALECMKEVANEKYPMPYMLADLSAYEDMPADKAYEAISDYIVDCLNVLRGDYMTESPYGMIDENDLLTIITETGYMMVNHIDGITQKELEKESIQSMMIKRISSGTAARFQKDKCVRKMGVVINTPEQANDACKSGDYSELHNFTGYPLDTFVNYAVCDKPKGDVCLIMAGMSKPMDRLAECTEIANKAADAMKAKNSGNIADELESLNFMSSARKHFNRQRVIGVSAIPNVAASDIADDIPEDIF